MQVPVSSGELGEGDVSSPITSSYYLPLLTTYSVLLLLLFTSNVKVSRRCQDQRTGNDVTAGSKVLCHHQQPIHPN